MKLAKWNAKAGKLLDDLLSSDQKMRFCNTADGVLFTDHHGVFCVYAPGSVVLRATNASDKRVLPQMESFYNNAISADGVLSDGVHGFIRDGGKMAKCRKLSSEKGDAYVYERVLRHFPANTMFCVVSPVKPIICGLWENGQLHVIGIAMPFLPRGREFIPA